MTLNLVDLEDRVKQAVRGFWTRREAAGRKQRDSGGSDQGERSGVTAGNNMNTFLALIEDVVRANGLPDAMICRNRALVVLPGYFRPTKLWDLLVLHRGELVAAVEMKSQVGPSFGSNFNNRAEEAIGTGLDLRVVHREGGFGDQPPPFAGWLILVEDAPQSRSSIGVSNRHFDVFEEFRGASYLQRYEILCRKLVQEQLYSTASVMASPRSASETGEYSEISDLTNIKTFLSTLAGHVATVSARHS